MAVDDTYCRHGMMRLDCEVCSTFAVPADELSDRVMLRTVLLGTGAMVAAAREMAHQGVAHIKGPAMILAYATELEKALMKHLVGDLPSAASVEEATFGLLQI